MGDHYELSYKEQPEGMKNRFTRCHSAYSHICTTLIRAIEVIVERKLRQLQGLASTTCYEVEDKSDSGDTFASQREASSLSPGRPI